MLSFSYSDFSDFLFSSKAKENLKVSGENFGKGLQISAEPIAIKPIEGGKNKVVQISEQGRTIKKKRKTTFVKSQKSNNLLSFEQTLSRILRKVNQ